MLEGLKSEFQVFGGVYAIILLQNLTQGRTFKIINLHILQLPSHFLDLVLFCKRLCSALLQNTF
jgi:hypothetical protein